MGKKNTDQNRIILTVFSVLAIFLIIYIVTVTVGLDKASDSKLRDFNGGWTDNSGNSYDIEDVRVDDYGVSSMVSRKLPMNITDGDCLCFESYNVNLDVWIDGVAAYSFKSEENITGLGYGTAYHEVGLSESDAGGTVQIRFERSNLSITSKRGHLENMYVGGAVPYVYMVMRSNLLTVLSSGLIIFFGLVFLLISFVISDNERLPFDVASLGLASLIIGAWLLVLSTVFQLISGHIYIVRNLDRFLILVAGVPLICFFNSLTYKKSRIYPLIEFWLNVVSIAYLLITRFVFGIDMMNTFQKMLILFFGQIIVLTIVIFVRHERYCRTNGIKSGLRFYYVGISAFIIFSLTDYCLYYFKKMIGNTYGTLTSVGTFVLIPIVLVQFIRWWTKDRRVVEIERFTNRALQYALSSDSPDESIRLMLEYMGTELRCKRVIVFEDSHNGRFHGRYAWFDSSLEKKSIDLLYVPYKGAVDRMISSYKENGNRYVLEDVERFKDENPSIYNMLMTYRVENVVANPLEVDGVVTGILLLLDMPANNIDEASSVANLTSYFLSQLILRRDDQKRMRIYTYNDSLSGAQNRRAYDEFVFNRLDLASSFGYMMCTISDLEEISDKGGFEAGDAVIADMVTVMSEVFGKENVFRLAGSRFAAFGFETDETYFYDDVARFEKNAGDKGISVLAGAVYCINGAKDIKTVVKRANEKMKEAIDDASKRRG
ncbi:MAG: diguanylate cyclase [Lachnospiraceae bacterium]|nr:diguanylate cyclase [Lachnospiraceae bacterium]